MKRLNILFIPKWYPSEAHAKAGVFVEELAQAVSLLHSVTVLFVYPSPKRIKRFYAVEQETKGNLKVIKVSYKSFLPLPGIIETASFNWWTYHMFKKILAPTFKPDLIHAHVYRAGSSALAIGKLTNSPVILSEHSMEFISRKDLTLEFYLFAKHVLKKFFRILPVSNCLKKHMQSLAPKTKFTVVPNVVNTKLFYPTPPSPSDKKRILSVSLLTYVKGIPDLLKALSLIKEKRQDFVLDIVGDGPERKKFEELVARYKLNDLVNFHGMKSKEEVAQFMRSCDFFVLPSWMETFGCVFIEALASGKPVVATEVGNIPDLIKNDMGVLVPPQDPHALEKAISHMLDNYSNYPYERMVKYVEQNFGYEAISKKLNQVYQEALEEWKKKSPLSRIMSR